MAIVFLGSEALARNEVTQSSLRIHHRRLFPDVYTPAVAALHGALWVGADTPIELLSVNHHPPPGIITRDEHFLLDDVMEIDGMPVATWQRAAYVIGRHLPRQAALVHVDSLSRAAGLTAEHVAPLIARYRAHAVFDVCAT